MASWLLQQQLRNVTSYKGTALSSHDMENAQLWHENAQKKILWLRRDPNLGFICPLRFSRRPSVPALPPSRCTCALSLSDFVLSAILELFLEAFRMASNGSLANNNEVAIVQPEHALYCFDVLADKLHSPSADAAAAAGHLEPRFHDGADVYPLFVTWNIKPRSSSASSKTDWRLRGCIGNFGGLPLTKGLQEYALIS